MTARTPERQAFYDDIFVTFAEGGVQMVACVEYAEIDNDREFAGLKGVHPYKRLDVRYYDDDTVTHTVTVDTFARAYSLIHAGPVKYLSGYSRKRLIAAYRECDAGDIDAVDATNIVEIGLFGEVVYG